MGKAGAQNSDARRELRNESFKTNHFAAVSVYGQSVLWMTANYTFPVKLKC
jgi:hypothetical protein